MHIAIPFRLIQPLLRLLPLLLLGACSGRNLASDPMGPCPDLSCDPYYDAGPVAVDRHTDVLYATDRRPVIQGTAETGFYDNRRGGALRLGVASLALAQSDGEVTWADAQQVPLLRDQTRDYPLQISGVREFGIQPASLSPLAPRALHESADEGAVRAFAAAVDARLRESDHAELTIFVHGYKMGFNAPLLLAAELSHYLDHRGVVIAYAWPSRESVWGYGSDIESAINSARNLRLLVLALARHSQAQRIHIVAHSAGTRLVTRMLADLAGSGDKGAVTSSRVGHVLLVSSDVDRDILAGYVLDGMLEVPATLTLYTSRRDGALRASETLFGRRRVGQTLGATAIDERSAEWLLAQANLHLIDVSDAPGSDAGRGHRYLRTSPWVRSDLLTVLRHDLPPGQRGLTRSDSHPLWRFPVDYPHRLRSALDPAGNAKDQ